MEEEYSLYKTILHKILFLIGAIMGFVFAFSLFEVADIYIENNLNQKEEK